MLFKLSLVLAVTLCATMSRAQEKLYSKTITESGPKGQEKKDSTFAEVKDESFQVSLHAVSGGARYSAQNAIHRSKITEPFKWVTLYLANADGSSLFFKDPQEFKQYMEAHGYKLVSETPQRYRTDYAFQKK